MLASDEAHGTVGHNGNIAHGTPFSRTAEGRGRVPAACVLHVPQRMPLVQSSGTMTRIGTITPCCWPMQVGNIPANMAYFVGYEMGQKIVPGEEKRERGKEAVWDKGRGCDAYL